MAKDGRIELLSDWLEKQLADSGITDGTIWQEMAMGQRTFYRLKPQAIEILNKRLQERQKLLEEAKGSEVVKAAKNGLKTKAERLMILQNEVDNSLKDLKTARKVFDKVSLRKVIKELQSEISKIEGDYAPTKGEFTGKDGAPLLQPIIVQPISPTETPILESETEE